MRPLLGYVRAYKPELKFKEYDIYKGIYCSLCKRLMKRYSPLSQLLLSYDVTFLAIVLMSVREKCVSIGQSRCCYNPLKKCHSCKGANDVLDFCADVTVILAYYKVCDNISDSTFFKKIAAYLILPFMSLIHKKAAKLQPEVEKSVSEAMKLQHETEKQPSCGADRAAHASAQSLSEILLAGVGDCGEACREKLRRFGYLLGRFVYIADAFDDVKDDIKTGSFNPMKLKYEAGKESFCEYVQSSINLNIGELLKCWDDISEDGFSDIIRNVIYYGLYNSAQFIIRKYDEGKCGREKSI